MLQKLKFLLVSLASVLAIGAPLAVTGTAMAYDQGNINDCLAQGSNFDFTTGQCTNTNLNDKTSLSDLVKKIVNILSVVVGIVAVIMIIIAGFRYVTSGGKQESVTGAKNTILYAIIGLIIVALAQIIVHFVLSNTT